LEEYSFNQQFYARQHESESASISTNTLVDQDSLNQNTDNSQAINEEVHEIDLENTKLKKKYKIIKVDDIQIAMEDQSIQN
jgi:hypothetical protein